MVVHWLGTTGTHLVASVLQHSVRIRTGAVGDGRAHSVVKRATTRITAIVKSAHQNTHQIQARTGSDGCGTEGGTEDLKDMEYLS